MEKIDKTKLGYLGAEFQYRLVKMFIEEPKYFERMEGIIDQNMFTENSLRNIVRIMKDEFSEHGNVPDYVTINTILGVNNSDNISLTIDRECLEKAGEPESNLAPPCLGQRVMPGSADYSPASQASLAAS